MMLPFISPEDATLMHDRNVRWAYGEIPFDELTIESTIWLNKLSRNDLLELQKAVENRLELYTYPSASSQFKKGSEYYVDFTLAE